MKKTTVLLIAVICVITFGALLIYGLRHSRGVPVAEEPKEKIVLEAPFIDKDIDLENGVSPDFWQGIAPKEIELMYQVTVLPWGKSLVSPVTVKAFHNKSDIYFYLSWKDSTEDRTVETGKFSDACAVMFPLKDDIQPSNIMMGFMGKANIWQWKASQDREYWEKAGRKNKAYTDFYYPFEEEEIFIVSKDEPESAANDLLAVRVGTITPKDRQNVTGRGVWNEGRWEVLLSRTLKAEDAETDAVFDIGKKRLCAFAVWNGAQGDRGGRKSVSDWVELNIK